MRKINKKQSLLLISITMLLLISVGFTIAFLLDYTSDVKNLFNPTEVTCEVNEDWEEGGLIKENVSIKNTGDVDAYIRAEIVVTWQNEQGEVLAIKPENEIDYWLELTQDLKWDLETTDGYYYYTSVVPSINDSATSEDQTFTSALINKCEVLQDAPTEGYTLHVEIIASAIQATGVSSTTGNPAVVDAWKVNYDSTNKAISK